MAANAHPRVFTHYFEMSDFSSVRWFCQDLTEPIDIVINNAGLQSKDKRMTKDGHELTWQVNYLCSTFLTIRLLLLRMIQAGRERGKRVRIINISSGMHRMVKYLELDDINFDQRDYGFVEDERNILGHPSIHQRLWEREWVSNSSTRWIFCLLAYTQSKLAQYSM